MSVCKQRTQNLINQRIVDEFLFGKNQIGYLDPSHFTLDLKKKIIVLNIKGKKYNFQFEKKLGSGTYGIVSKYRDHINNVYIAIKESSDDEDIITDYLLKANCNVLRSRAIGKVGKGVKNRIYIMELAEADLLELAYIIQKPTGVQFILNIVEQIRRQMICIYELTHDHSFIYTDLKLQNILYRCDNPDNLNSYRVFLGDLGGCLPTKVSHDTYAYITTYPPLPRKQLVGINNEKEKLDFMSWEIGVLLLLMRAFLVKTKLKVNEELTNVEDYFYHKTIPSNPAFLQTYKKVLRDTYDNYRTPEQIASGFSFANYIDIKNRNSPYEKITDIQPQPQPPQQPQSQPQPPQQPQSQPQAQSQLSSHSFLKEKLQLLTVVQLRQRAKELGCKGQSSAKRKDVLINFIVNCINNKKPTLKPVSHSKPIPVSPAKPTLKTTKKLMLLTVVQLKQLAKKLGCSGYSSLNKDELVKFIAKFVKNNNNK